MSPARIDIFEHAFRFVLVFDREIQRQGLLKLIFGVCNVLELIVGHSKVEGRFRVPGSPMEALLKLPGHSRRGGN